MKYLLPGLFLLVVLTACGVSPEQIDATVMAGILQTQTAVPTGTFTPTAPPLTPTPQPSATSTLTPLTLGGAGKLLLGLARCTPDQTGGCLYESRGIYLTDLDGSQPQLLLDQASLAALSPDGSQALVSQGSPGSVQTLSVLNLADSNLLALSAIYENDYPCNQAHCGAVWLPDGQRVAFLATMNDEKSIFMQSSTGSGILQVTWPGSNPQPVYLYRAASSDNLFWAKGSTSVVEGVYTAKLDGSEQKLIEKIREPVFSPDGKQVAYLKSINDLGFQDGFFISMVDWAGETQVYAPQINESVDAYSWSSDGSWLIFAVTVCNPQCNLTKLYLWSASGSGLVELPQMSGQLVQPPVWSPNSQVILLNSYDPVGGQHFYQAVSLETLTLQPILKQFSLPEGEFIDGIWVKP